MAPVATSTRDRLLDEAELLFAHGGVQGTTTREIVEAADQRNTSAVSYHFGSREGLLLALLARRGAPVDAERGRLRGESGDSCDTAVLVRCLVKPYTVLLHTPGGRAYVRIVAQLRGTFAAWRVESDAATTTHMSAILDELEQRAAGSDAVRRERLVAMIMLLTSVTAERARVLDDGVAPELDDDQFTDGLIDMCTAVLVG